MTPPSSIPGHSLRSRILTFLTAAAGVTSATAFPLKYGAIRSGQENPNVKPYTGRLAGRERPLLLMGGDSGPCVIERNASWPDVPLLASEQVRASCLADVTGDGIDDFIAVLHDTTQTASNSGSRIMATYRGTPDGFVVMYKMPFTSASYPYNPQREQIVPADLDLDGDPDIVLLDAGTGAYEQSVSFFTNFATNTGRLDTETSVVFGNRNTMELRDVVVMHANLDDYPDIVVADRIQNKIRVFLNNTTGGFSEGTSISEDAPAKLFAVDIDRDGKKDLLSASGYSGGTSSRLVWRKFQGLGFASPSILDTQTGDSRYGGAALGDITDDGVDDLLFVRTAYAATPGGNSALYSSVWYRAGNPNTAGAFFTTTQITELEPTFHTIHSIAAGDIDRDGDMDIWCSSGDSTAWTQILLLENLRPHGDTAAVVTDYSGTHPTGAASLACGDLNGDSWPDLAIAAAGTRAILWYAGSPSGALAAPVTVSTGGLAPSCLSAGDLTGDGTVDLAWAVTSTGDIKRARNTNGSGTSWSTSTIANLPGLNSLTMTSVNRDNDLDFLASSSSGTVQWYYNSNEVYTVDTVLNQTGVTRAVPMWVKANVRQQMIALSPVNNGNVGKVDIRDHFLLGSPPWTVLHTEQGGGANASAAATCGDMNRDGYEDCVWCAGSSEVKWRDVNSVGAVTNTIGTAPGVIRNLRRIDWNMDGWDDVLCAHSTGVLIWINDLGNGWKTLTLYTGGDCTDAIPFKLDAGRQTDVAAVDTSAGRLKLITHAPVVQQIEVSDAKVPSFGSVLAEPATSPYVMRLEHTHLGLEGRENLSDSEGGWRTDSPAIGEHYRFRFMKGEYQANTNKWVPVRALTQAELSASVEKIMVIDDSWGGAASSAALDSPNDVVLGEAAVSLTNGYQSVTITANPAVYENSVLNPAASTGPRLFVALKMKPNVSAAITGHFFIQHIIDPAQSGTRYATTLGWPARQILGVTGTPDATGYEVRIISAYDLWRKSWFGSTSNNGASANNADGDRDGMDNLTEYILGKNPTIADAGPTMLMERSANSQTLYVDLPATAREDGILTLQQSTDLYNWTTYAQLTGDASVWTGAPNVTIAFNGGRRTTFAPPVTTSKFYRVVFSLVP